MGKQFSPEEIKFVKSAAKFFDHPGFMISGMNVLSQPIAYAERKLPQVVRNQISKASRTAIEGALKISIQTLPERAEDGIEDHPFDSTQKKVNLSNMIHTGATTVVGGLGGFFGLPALPFELPLTTTLMLRSIADISRHHGNDLSKLESRLECLYVFSLGNESAHRGVQEPSYYSSRVAFSELFKTASSFIAGHTTQDILHALENKTAPSLVRLIAKIAGQFEIRVTKKLLAQATPIAGAVGGAGINLLFSNYYNKCSKYHFGLKKLERIHGREATQALFESFAK